MPHDHHHDRHCRDRRHAKGDHRGEHGHHRHGGGGKPRFFDHGDLRLVILALTAERPRHGYDIIKAIEERVGGSYSPSPGVVYPTLTLLEDLGHVSVTAEAGRKLHDATDAGRAFLAENEKAVAAIFARMGEVSAAHGGGPAPQVVRGMENLKLALRLRLARGPLDEAQLRSVAAALDAAASAVENA